MALQVFRINFITFAFPPFVGICETVSEGFRCMCSIGWQGKTCAQNIDECKNEEHLCEKLTKFCINTPGSFVCKERNGKFSKCYWRQSSCTDKINTAVKLLYEPCHGKEGRTLYFSVVNIPMRMSDFHWAKVSSCLFEASAGFLFLHMRTANTAHLCSFALTFVCLHKH